MPEKKITLLLGPSPQALGILEERGGIDHPALAFFHNGGFIHAYIHTLIRTFQNDRPSKNMTIPIKKSFRKPAPRVARPILVYANWFQFAASQSLSRPRVESRMFLSVHHGSGTLTINGRLHPARAGSWFFLPWAHAIEYTAAAADPFLIGGIHLIPDHAPGVPVLNQVAHHPEDPLSGVRYRRDADLPCGRGLRQGSFEPGRGRLNALIHYLIESFHPERPDRQNQHEAAKRLLAEIGLNLRQVPATSPGLLSPVLFRLETYIRQNLHGRLTVVDLAKVACCSVAGVHRMFRLGRKQTPARWVAGRRMERAAYLLRTTRSPVKQIAEEIGIPDPFQFSRFFKRHTGCSPRTYRIRQGIL